MSKLKSLDKQLEDMSIKWYIKEYYGEELTKNKSKEYRMQVIKEIKSSTNKNDMVKEYLSKHPKVKQQYVKKKKAINRVKFLIGTGILTVAVGVGAYTVSKNTEKAESDNQQIEYTLYEEPEAQENEYEKFFEELRNIKNTNARDEEIVNFTKEKIVEAYNMKNKDNPITADRLQYLELNENVVAHIDARGYDVSYERISQREQYNQQENEVLKNMTIYEFKIDGKTVAVYNRQGDEIVDSDIENKEEFFRNTIGLLDKTQKLQGAYKYNNSEYDISILENNYENVAEELIQEQQTEKNDYQRSE